MKYNLKNGDVVEILTQAGHLPSKDWLALVKTSRARNKIKHVINATERAKAIEIGQKYLEREARRLGVSLSRSHEGRSGARRRRVRLQQDGRSARRAGIRQVFGAAGAAEAGAGSGGTAPPEPAKPAAPGRAPGRRADNGDLVIKVKGIDDLLVYRAKCCNPIRGEAIVGYVTRGKGVAVHSTHCSNVQNLMYEVERKIDVEWARAATETFPVKMVVHTDDRPGMLNQLTSVLFAEQSNIRSLEARTDEARNGDGAVIDMTVEVKDKKQLERIVAAMRRISGRARCRAGSVIMSETNDPEHIAISKSKGIKIDWKDGHHSDYELAYLRDECPCATCTGAHGTEPQKTNYSAPRKSVPDVQARAEDAERGAGGPLRDPHRVERRAQHRYLLLRPFPQNLPL